MHNAKLHNLPSSLNAIRMINSNRIGMAGHVARMEENTNKVVVGKP
jgi:hypothetical protein